MSNSQKVTDDLIEEAMRMFPTAKLIAVQNFCWTAPDDDQANGWNLGQDARLYEWNSDTVDAIAWVLRAEKKL
jgi:hypothetical protein